VINVFAVLKGDKEIDKILFFFKQVVFGLLLYSIHMLNVKTNALPFDIGEYLAKGKPILLVQIPHVLNAE
jgi:hypothetical protein